MTDFQQKTAVIIGGAGGMGRELALRLAGEGARVFVGDLGEEAISGVIGEGSPLPGSIDGAVCDLANDQSVARFSDAAFAALGHVDFLFNHAGVSLAGPLEAISSEDWAWLLNVNVTGLGRSIANFLPRMSSQGQGWIVNTSSGLGLFHDLPLAAPYIASKAAIIAYSRALAIYIRNRGLRVSVFAPEITNTNFLTTARIVGIQTDLVAGGLPAHRIQTAEQAVDLLLKGLTEERFLISATEGTELKLRAMADHMLQPGSDQLDACGNASRISQIASMRVPEGHAEQLSGELADYATKVPGHHGCIAYEVARDMSDPCIIRIFEIWSDQAALDSHVAAPETLAILGRLFSLGASDFTTRPL